MNIQDIDYGCPSSVSMMIILAAVVLVEFSSTLVVVVLFPLINPNKSNIKYSMYSIFSIFIDVKLCISYQYVCIKK